jgi:hypothetical protein
VKHIDLVSAIEEAIVQARRAKALGWTGLDGRELRAEFDHLERELIGALEGARRGQEPDRDALAGLQRWVLDWIPDLDDPLVEAIDGLQQTDE